MKIAFDPYMHRHLNFEKLPFLAANLGYEYIELSPHADFLDWFAFTTWQLQLMLQWWVHWLAKKALRIDQSHKA